MKNWDVRGLPEVSGWRFAVSGEGHEPRTSRSIYGTCTEAVAAGWQYAQWRSKWDDCFGLLDDLFETGYLPTAVYVKLYEQAGKDLKAGRPVGLADRVLHG